MSGRHDREPRLRVVAIADADSYVKWGAAILDAAPHASTHLVLLRTPLTVSDEQQRAALAGSSIGPSSVTRVEHSRLASWIAQDRPDVVVIAGRGPFVRLVMRQIDRIQPRPVVVTGLPGMSIPAQRAAVLYRRQSDLMLVHSLREERAFAALSEKLGAPVELGLATLPYARRRTSTRTGTDLVFAAQAIVPREADERRELADILRRAALADPSRRVVVKLRSRADRGEHETHYERLSFPELLAERPDNLVFSHESMRSALSTAAGLVTVSSTAAIEAVALGVPVIALDTFGVDKAHLNTVFADSGLLGSADDVIERRFRHPSSVWMADNYFHDESESRWWPRVVELVAERRAGRLEAHPVPAPRGGALRLAWDRKAVLGYEDTSLSGALALAIGTPLVSLILATRGLRGRRAAEGWADDTSDITVTPARFQDPIVRRRTPAAAVAVD